MPSSDNTFSGQEFLLVDEKIIYEDDFWDIKDPSPVAVPDKFNKKIVYHIYGTKGAAYHEAYILHLVSDSPYGPWTELNNIETDLRGDCVGAPGGMYDSIDQRVHLFLQTDYMRLGGSIEHLTSDDGGYSFYHQGTVLTSIPKTEQSGLYDPQPLIITTAKKIERYIIYTGMARVAHGNVYLAKSIGDSWDGPYETKRIITNEEIKDHHNQPGSPNYEWGLEGGNIVVLPNGKFLFVGVCFLPDGENGTRQRVFKAVSDDIEGPYRSLGPMINPAKPGENGHPGVIMDRDILRLYYQRRDVGGPWRLALRNFNIDSLLPPY